MNSKDCKKISRQTDLILVEWLKTLVSDEEKEQINTSNIHSLLPSANYFFMGRTLRLSFYTPKWVRQSIKKLFKLGREIESITMSDLEAYTKSRGVHY
jgi:hypothetical protein